MPPQNDGLSKYLQIYMMMEGLEVQRQQLEFQREQAKRAAFAVLPELAKGLREPHLFANNAPQLGEELGLEPNLVANYLRSVAPGREAQQTTAIESGIQSMMPQRRRGLFEEAAGVGLAGQTRGGLAESDFMADLIEGRDDFDRHYGRVEEHGLLHDHPRGGVAGRAQADHGCGVDGWRFALATLHAHHPALHLASAVLLHCVRNDRGAAGVRVYRDLD